MSWSAVSSAVTTIGKLLSEEAVYLWGVEKQVDRLQTELKWMRSSLMEADEKQHTDERIRLWVAEIRELAYDAEDVIEDFVLRVGSKKKGGLSGCIKRPACLLNEGRTLHKTRSKIDEILERMLDLVRRLQLYGVKGLKEEEGSSSLSVRRELRRPYPHIIDQNTVGLKDGIEELVPVLVEAGAHTVVSIWGMGGLGKTTLAKKLYHHSRVNSHFDHLALVFVSQQFQTRKVWEDILSGFKKLDADDRKQNDVHLASKLFNLLKHEKCLVILDDIWSTEAWDRLKPAFPAATGIHSNSKILLTTRNKEIVSHADRSGYLYELPCLNDEESWELLQKTAFPPSDSTDDRVDAERKELGKAMVKHCAGLPLAIVVLGGILATKTSLDEWQRVSENVKSYLNRSRGQEIMEVLALSYDDLPAYLKPCFLYLSHYPEDHEIRVNRLTQLWVAEGIVSSEEGDVAEDVAEHYVIELVERCMIQVQRRDIANLQVETFQMHDITREFCLSQAKKDNFVFIADESNAGSLSTFRKVRRVSMHKCFETQRIECPNLRSLSLFNTGSLEELHEVNARGFWAYIFTNLKLLRVVNYEGRAADAGCKLIGDIGNLIHLRFLSLRKLRFQGSKLPSSLGNLTCLQTLDLRGDSHVHVPDVIWRMEQLRHLHLPHKCDDKTKLRLDTLTNLLTLVNFNTKICCLKDLINMTNLRQLAIYGHLKIEDFNEENLDENPPIIQGKNLHTLSIITLAERIDPRHLNHLLSSCASICKLTLHVEISKLSDLQLPSNLAYIQLNSCKLEEDPMPTLKQMTKLRALELRNRAFQGREICCSAQGFPKLEYLRFGNLPMEQWKVDKGAMPCLRHLEILVCKELKMLPDGLEFITTLQELRIIAMPKAFRDRVGKEGPDFNKIQHVPSVIFLR